MRNNNTIIGTIKSSELFNINIEIPNIQKFVDKDKVNDILKYYINNFKLYKSFNVLVL